jgi:hypothetical protein
MLILAMLERYDVGKSIASPLHLGQPSLIQLSCLLEPLSPFPQYVKTERIGVGVAEPSQSWKVRLVPRF